MITEWRTEMRKFVLLISLCFLINCASEKSPVNSPLSPSEIKRLSAAKSFEDIFEKASEIQFSTSPDSAIKLITDMEIDSKGNFIVADGWQRRGVFIFAPDGQFIKELGKQGQGPGEYSTPVSVSISSKHEIYVADYLGNRINIYDENLTFKKSVICRPRIHEFIHLNSQDEIFIYSGTINPFRPVIFDTVHKYNDQGEEILSFAPLPQEVLKLKFSAVQDGITVDKDGFIYEMNPLLYKIRKFSAQGKLIKEFSRKTGHFKLVTKEGETPIIVYGPYYLEKGLIIAQVSEHLEVYDTEGNFIVGELPFQSNIIATRDNNFYVQQWEEKEALENLPSPKIICYKLKI
jgi:hypothetical protein